MNHLLSIDFFTKAGQSPEVWVPQIFLVVFLTLLFNFFLKRLIAKLQKKVENTKNLWDDAFLHALTLPAQSLVWLLGICWAVDIGYGVSNVPVFLIADKLRAIGFILVIAWFLIRFIREAEGNLSSEEYMSKPMDETTVSAMGKLLRASVFITTVLVVMQYLGYSISGVLAFGGIGGIAVGFASKDLLANFFGGLMIYLDRPFAVGDWIRSPDKEIEGTVEEIGWRLTRIRTFDKRPLYVPNSTFTQIAVENPSRMTNRRIKETIGIRYQDADKMAAIVEDVKNMLMQHPEIDTTQTLIVNFNTFSASSIDFFIYTFTKTRDWVLFHSIKQDVLLRVMAIIESHGAEIAFPTSTLHIADMPEPGKTA